MKSWSTYMAIVALFFLWALAHNLNPILIPQLKKAFGLSDWKAAWVDSSFYLAYFLSAVPAGMVIRNRGYKSAIVWGLLLFALGALLFFPAASLLSYSIFLAALFTIGFGLTFLETAANPLVTQFDLGKKPAFLLNLAQSFNGLGASLAGWLGGFLIFGNTSSTSSSAELAQSVMTPYLMIGLTVLLVAILFSQFKLPVFTVEDKRSSPLHRSHFRWAAAAQFFYVGAQVGVSSFFIRYVVQYEAWTEAEASYFFSIALLLFMLGRFMGTALLNWLSASRLLQIAAMMAILFSVLIGCKIEGALVFLLLLLLVMSIMFPTIFSMAMEGIAPSERPLGSSYIIMTIVGGALIPPIMGWVSDAFGLSAAYWVPSLCFGVVFIFALKNNEANA